MNDLVIFHSGSFLFLFLLGVNLKGERNIENKNLKSNYSKQQHDDYSNFISLHKLFYLSPVKFCDKDNWKILCQVIYNTSQKT